jgi:hypothetical protein
VIKEHFERRRERRLEIGNVGQMKLQRPNIEQLVVGCDSTVNNLLKPGMRPCERPQVLPVCASVLCLLSQKTIRLLRHGLVGDPRLRFSDDSNDVFLERDGHHADHVHHAGELRIVLMPSERHVIGKVERYPSDF